MIRVGFVLGDLNDSNWLGGLNYYRNLFTALDLISERKIQPVVFIANNDAGDRLRDFGNVEFVATRLLNRADIVGRLWNGLGVLFRNNDLISRHLLTGLLKGNRVEVLSHFVGLGPGSAIKTVGWIPDFQHMHMPGFFDAGDIRIRNRMYASMARNCDRIVLSSRVAQNDLARFAPHAVAKSFVLPFVPEVDQNHRDIQLGDLQRKYAFEGPYFFLPSQFWVHKNHGVVIGALSQLRKQGIAFTVLASGKGYDYRNPGYFEQIMNRVGESGLSESFRYIGVIPYLDVLALLRFSIAVINPSLFEGWSSTVEEGKCLGKTIILSDIQVHREQDPRNAIFFPPDSSAELAQAMIRAFADSRNAVESAKTAELLGDYRTSRRAFAERYEQMIVELVAMKGDAGLRGS